MTACGGGGGGGGLTDQQKAVNLIAAYADSNGSRGGSEWHFGGGYE